MFNAEHWAEQLRHLQPDLVIINYGTNESGYAAFVDKSYGKELTGGGSPRAGGRCPTLPSC